MRIEPHIEDAYFQMFFLAKEVFSRQKEGLSYFHGSQNNHYDIDISAMYVVFNLPISK